jgi:transcriptional regulator with XRE-family HTH domain
MKLARYLSENGLTQEQFAGRIGVSQAWLSRLAGGSVYASFEVLLRVQEATDGAVTPNDFLPPPTRQVAQAAE